MSTVPTQERVVDPFASYNSQAVNKLSQCVTQDVNGLLTPNSLQVTLDTTATVETVVVSSGYLVKDDVLIHITSDHVVDLTDGNNYFDGNPPAVGGFYYLVIDYTYAKSRPAPQTNIKILAPDQRSLLTSETNYFLLKVIELDNTLPIQIMDLYDYDPEITTNERKYIKYYTGSVTTLPSFDQERDQSRMTYVSGKNTFFFGYSDGWRELAAGGITMDLNTDSTGIVVGSVCYVDENRNAIPAIANSVLTGADVVVHSIGTAITGEGGGTVAGFVEGVQVEPGTLIGIGDLLYLSATSAGTVTNIKSSPFFQVVGRALSLGSSTTPVDMIFSPKVVLALGVEGQITSWLGPDGDGKYYQNLDVSALDGTNAYAVHLFNNANHREIEADTIEIKGEGNVVRVYMTDNTAVVDYIILGGASIGSGSAQGIVGGVSDHLSLTSLDYASSGHTGFAPTPHNNTHHSQNYITTTGVNFTNLNANGSVGALANQIAQGNHTHPEYVDIPTVSVVLFESDTSIAGYSLLTSVDDELVYVTKGSAAGGQTGGSLKTGGTWTQPSHSHVIPWDSDHAHNTGSTDIQSHEMPYHTHTFVSSDWVGSCSTCYIGQPGRIYLCKGGWKGDGAYVLTGTGTAPSLGDLQYVGNTYSHTHGITSYDGFHDHGVGTGGSQTINTWRPRGRNYTRQQRI